MQSHLGDEGRAWFAESWGYIFGFELFYPFSNLIHAEESLKMSGYVEQIEEQCKLCTQIQCQGLPCISADWSKRDLCMHFIQYINKIFLQNYNIKKIYLKPDCFLSPSGYCWHCTNGPKKKAVKVCILGKTPSDIFVDPFLTYISVGCTLWVDCFLPGALSVIWLTPYWSGWWWLWSIARMHWYIDTNTY